MYSLFYPYNRYFKFILSFCLFLFISTTSVNSQTWELRECKNGVTVYTRSVAGSDVEEFKGETTVKSNLGSLLNILDDFKNYPTWVYNCSYAESVKKVSTYEGYAYNVYEMSWPVSNRDLVVHYYITQNEQTKVILLKLDAVNGYVPDKGYVRITYLKGFYEFTPKPNGYVHIIYQVHSDPGGYVPTSIVNAFVYDSPYYSLLNLKKKVESPSFIKTYRKEIQEL
jgi:hypothetical protein